MSEGASEAFEDELVAWACIERAFLQEEIKFLEDGGVVKSPDSVDVTEEKLEKLQHRLEHACNVIDGKVPLKYFRK